MTNLGELRQEYKRHSLSEHDVDKDAIVQFEHWFHEALESGVHEPNAFVLATSGASNLPSARVLLLKGIDQGGFVFYTNYNSHKAADLRVNPHGSMVFLWLELERQVRISGSVNKVTREETEAYFHSRPRESQLGAWVSNQSETILSREFLEGKLQDLLNTYTTKQKIPVPEFWGGFRLIPNQIEFWQGRPNRLHDRILYTKTENGWGISRLSP
jgi:pyridoxamine 5'-phosphate oxidase